MKIEIQPFVDEILRLGIEEFESMNVKDLNDCWEAPQNNAEKQKEKKL